MTQQKLKIGIVTIEMEVWCSDARHFNDLQNLLENPQGTHESINAKFGGYGYEIKTNTITARRLARALGFTKDDLE